ncbi:MAG: ATP-binding cassette domain-containing protein [Candidatus Pacebacteria bacterium]|nr:ATP-binding cassette domain-containing protein [Candidatus Paceibacterota bacterium]
MILLDNVSKIYPNRSLSGEPITALENVSFKVGKSEFISLSGRSGAGKTTLLRLILGQEAPSSGRILFDSYDISEIKKSEICHLRRRIGTVFQDYKLFPTKTTYENISYIMEVMGADDEEIKRDVPYILDLVGLTERACNFPKELSGGEKQRLAIARALIHRPEVILADEPTGNLDPYHTSGIIRLLLKINDLGTAVILATHDKEVINKIRKRVITLENGRVARDDEKGRFML